MAEASTALPPSSPFSSPESAESLARYEIASLLDVSQPVTENPLTWPARSAVTEHSSRPLPSVSVTSPVLRRLRVLALSVSPATHTSASTARAVAQEREIALIELCDHLVGRTADVDVGAQPVLRRDLLE